jgi:hypothetical protein
MIHLSNLPAEEITIVAYVGLLLMGEFIKPKTRPVQITFALLAPLAILVLWFVK